MWRQKRLHNYLNRDLHFKDIKIDIESADKMTDNEKHAFVNNHFKIIVVREKNTRALQNPMPRDAE